MRAVGISCTRVGEEEGWAGGGGHPPRAHRLFPLPVESLTTRGLAQVKGNRRSSSFTRT